MTQVRDTKAGRAIKAFVVLDKRGDQVATVHAHYSEGGTVTVNVWDNKTCTPLQKGRAGGYGYDKFTAALSGLVIDGHKLTDHCQESLKPPKGRLWQDSDRAKLAKKGFVLSNWTGPREEGKPFNSWGREGVPDEASGYVSAYRLSGLRYLEALGYRVLQAI